MKVHAFVRVNAGRVHDYVNDMSKYKKGTCINNIHVISSPKGLILIFYGTGSFYILVSKTNGFPFNTNYPRYLVFISIHSFFLCLLIQKSP